MPWVSPKRPAGTLNSEIAGRGVLLPEEISDPPLEPIKLMGRENDFSCENATHSGLVEIITTSARISQASVGLNGEDGESEK